MQVSGLWNCVIVWFALTFWRIMVPCFARIKHSSWTTLLLKIKSSQPSEISVFQEPLTQWHNFTSQKFSKFTGYMPLTLLLQFSILALFIYAKTTIMLNRMWGTWVIEVVRITGNSFSELCMHLVPLTFHRTNGTGIQPHATPCIMNIASAILMLDLALKRSTSKLLKVSTQNTKNWKWCNC